MTNTYTGNPADSSKDAVRFWIQDTAAPWKLTDEEINYTISQFTNPMLAAASCANALAARYAAFPSKRVGDFSISYGELAKNYAALAAELESKGQTFNLVPWSGGITHSDREIARTDTNRVKPPFRRDQFDNPSGANNLSSDGWPDGGGE